MSKERARRRDARERLALAAAADRRAVAERRARRAARVRTVSRYLPATHSRPTGLLVERKRRELLATGLVLVVLNIVVFVVAGDWALTALVLVASILGAPVLYLMLFRRS